MPDISFVVPVYEPSLDLLGKCVKSLVDQSLKSWEAIFVLDGENDSAAQVIRREMKKCPNHYKIVVQEHSGVQRARNEGFKHTTADILCFLDCDVLIEPEAPRMWVEQFERHQDIGFIYSGYKFLNEQGAINSEPFDPWTLRIRNYISTCFPIRRKFYPGWNESLKSLQDWDFWLSAVEKGAVGKFVEGYAFSTAYPTQKSISGQGCTPEAWLERVNAVKKLHNLPERDICVSSLQAKHEGIFLAKLIGADYQDVPNQKPHNYKTILQLGFSFLPGKYEHHIAMFTEKTRNVLFWTSESIAEIRTMHNWEALEKYGAKLNEVCTQFVEDEAAQKALSPFFKTQVCPLPLAIPEVKPLPKDKRFLVDINANYGPVLDVLAKSLPDVELEPIGDSANLNDYTGLVYFHPDRTTSPNMKRAALLGRAVVSTVPGDFTGFVDPGQSLDKFIPAVTNRIRSLAYSGPDKKAISFYREQCNVEKFKECINA